MKLIKFLDEKILSKTADYIFAYKSGCIYLRDKNKKLLYKKRIAPFYISIRLIERLLRYEPRVATHVSRYEFIFSFHGYIYCFNAKTFELKAEHKFITTMNNSLYFTSRYEKDKLVDLLYGEYLGNYSKGPISIYRRTSEGEWESVYTYPAGTIKHIHNIIFDKYRNCYLILTGDDDSESAIWVSDIQFKSVEKLVGGKQKHRSCIAIPTEKYIYYLTDTPLETNYLYRINLNDNSVETIEKISGPVIYGKEYNNFLYFATSVEGDSKHSKYKYLLSNKLGFGVNDRFTHLYKLDIKNERVFELTKISKDILPMGLFQFGNLFFSDSDILYVSPQSLNIDYGTYLINE